MQDAHEFFSVLLEALHEEWLANGAAHEGDARASAVDANFGSTVEHCVVCSSCGWTNRTREPCRDFSVDVALETASPASSPPTVSRLLTQYFAKVARARRAPRPAGSCRLP